MKIIIEPQHFEIVSAILSQYPYKFYAFGSRAKGNPKKFSDLDLFYKEKIPSQIISILEEDFEESDLPYKVDIVDFNNFDEEMKLKVLTYCIEFI